MARVDFSITGRADLRKVINDLQRRAGSTVAVEFIGKFEATFDRLGEFPGIGSPRRRLGARVRMLVVAPCLNFHDGGPKATSVTVLRLLHGSRRITRRAIAVGRDHG